MCHFYSVPESDSKSRLWLVCMSTEAPTLSKPLCIRSSAALVAADILTQQRLSETSFADVEPSRTKRDPSMSVLCGPAGVLGGRPTGTERRSRRGPTLDTAGLSCLPPLRELAARDWPGNATLRARICDRKTLAKSSGRMNRKRHGIPLVAGGNGNPALRS